MKKLWIKCLAVILCLIALCVGLVGGLFTMAQWDTLMGRRNFYSSLEYDKAIGDYRSLVYSGLEMKLYGEDSGTLSYGAQKQLNELEDSLAPDNTNFRFRFLSPDGTVLWTNLAQGEDLQQDVYSVWGSDYVISRSDSEGVWVRNDNYYLECGVTDPLTVEDGFTAAKTQYESILAYLPSIAVGSLVALAVGVFCLIYLILVAGRRQDQPGVVLNRQDRVPFDLYLLMAFGAGAFCISMGDQFAYYYNRYRDTSELVLFCLTALGFAAICLATLLTFATRVKTHTLFRNTLIWRCCGRVRRAFGMLPMVWRAVALFLAYLLGTFLSGITIILIPVFQVLVLYLLCRWCLQWREIRACTAQIEAGNLDIQIDNTKFYPDLYQHAAQLNNIGAGLNNAVAERMKSEHFKAELITNVSHDLKTPLTSIINYVGLLQKEAFENEKAREYIEVLDRKSQRLKKLTEDLVEASKASTGTLSVTAECLDVAQLVVQIMGEYQEKLTACALTLIPALPEGEVFIRADGRHLWRVLDNLLGNCVKYALENTRVYLDVVKWDGNVIISVKNISRQPLNLSAESLMERFVRGDESRTTEGSGLGLSIARSLTELQGGRFGLSIDGDLFKATVTFPADNSATPLQENKS